MAPLAGEAPGLRELIRTSRRLKWKVCARDPLEARGLRQVLNFGHTFAHVLEGLSGFRLSHGAAVRLGVVCALDIGRSLGATPDQVAIEVERGFERLGQSRMRPELARRLGRVSPSAIDRLLRSDKKSRDGALRMVLLTELGQAELRSIPPAVWKKLARSWKTGGRP